MNAVVIGLIIYVVVVVLLIWGNHRFTEAIEEKRRYQLKAGK